MKFKLALALCLTAVGLSANSATKDIFLEKYYTCTPYTSVFKAPLTGESYERGVLGVRTNSMTKNLNCVYYRQMSSTAFQLCERRTNKLSTDKPFSRTKVECTMTDRAGLKKAQEEIRNNNYEIEYVDAPTYTPIQQ